MGFTFATHLCGGLAVKSELGIGDFFHGLDCGMANMDAKKSKPSNEIHFAPEDCCNNVAFQIDIQDDYQFSLEQPSVYPVFCFAPLSFYYNFTSLKASNQLVIYDYAPPHPKIDLQVLIQSFLI
jgi:hypothetical protein